MFEKFKKFGKRAKAILMAGCVALTCAVTSVAAFAEDGTGTDTGVTETVTETVDMSTVLADAGEQITSQFNDLVMTIIPVILGILGAGLVIFGIFALIKVSKKIFGKVAG